MQQFAFELIFEYGAFPCIVVYLLYVILKEQKGEIKEIQNRLDTNFDKFNDTLKHQSESINEMVNIMGTMHNTMANQMNALVIKLIEASHKNGGEK